MPWLCTTIAGSMPIFCASCRAAPSASGPGGTGSVNDVCTIPSPVVSPYGRITLPCRPSWPTWPASGTGHLRVQQLQGRVDGVRREPDDAVQALAAVRGPPGDAEGAVGDRLDQALGVVGDPLQQGHGLGEHGVRAAVDEP